jgi:hypothetical protein
MSPQQWDFLEGEFLTLSINAALQHSSTYATEDEKDREAVRRELRSALCDLSARYADGVSEEQHLENIQQLSRRVSQACASSLNGDHLRLGIAQKALNLYLKYLWCVGRIPIPPHCPFDNNVINVAARLKLPPGCERRWTQVSAALEEAKKKGLSLAAWELGTWSAAQGGKAGCPQGRPAGPPNDSTARS